MVAACSLGLLLVSIPLYLKLSVYQDPSMKFPRSCRLHGESIERKRVLASSRFAHIDYWAGFPEAYYAAEVNLFPYSGEGLWDSGYRGRWVRWIDKKSCAACFCAERKWRREWVDGVRKRKTQGEQVEAPNRR